MPTKKTVKKTTNRTKVKTNIAFDKAKQLYYVTLYYPATMNHKSFKSVRTTKSLEEAEAILAKHKSDVLNHTLLPPTKYTLESFSKHWIEIEKAHHCKPTTIYGYNNMLNNYIIPKLGKENLQELTPMHITNYVNQLKNNDEVLLSERTLNKHIDLLRAILKDACSNGLVSKNVAMNVKKFSNTSNYEYLIYSEEEIAKLLQASQSSPIELPVKLGLLCGLRRGEINGLKWCNVNFEKNEIRIRQTVVQVGDKDILTNPKSKTSIRTLNLPDGLMNLLHQIKEKQEKCKDLLHSDYHDNDLVFCKANGEPYKANYISNAFKKLLTRANLPNVRFHDLRHMFASYALAAGIPQVELSYIMGHSSPTVTLNIYAHCISNNTADVLNKVYSLFSSCR